MRDLLLCYKEQILKHAEIKFTGITEITEIRINMSAVFKCVYNDKPCIFKYLLIEDSKDIEESQYLMIHAEKMLKLSKCTSFPDIYETSYLEVGEYNFLMIVEELLPYSFSEGMIKLYEDNCKDVVKSSSLFLLNLLHLYIEGREHGFVSHRDLSFDNIMFDEQYNVKMIDLGSAKSTEAETTMFHRPAPTKKFYSAPEYEEIHRGKKTESELIKAEIYTIGLITLSLLNSLDKHIFEQNTREKCGIVSWLSETGKKQDFNGKFMEFHKRDYINYILINVFSGDDKNNLYKLLKGMTDNSVSARIPDYDFIIKVLEREVK